jgi:peroxiredoxin Q/BCP
MLKAGDKAPDFVLPDQNGKDFKLSELRDKENVILYFYPKDHSPGCTAQSCSFRDNASLIKSHGTTVVGISSDSISSHRDFARNHALPFKILSDTNHQVEKLYGVRSFFGFMPGRATYVIDKLGFIRYVFSSHLNIQGHVDKSLEIIKKL